MPERTWCRVDATTWSFPLFYRTYAAFDWEAIGVDVRAALLSRRERLNLRVTRLSYDLGNDFVDVNPSIGISARLRSGSHEQDRIRIKKNM